ncbi:MAG: hypothetical protein L0Z62_46620, partial [Gemmataceae bacterium]|nr:hypothetical protein [Gemmataceae bacterium]
GSLMVALPRAEFQSRTGSVAMVLLADVGNRGPLPVLEAGVKLHTSKDVDLDVTLDRGLIGFENLKKKGPAKVRVHVRGEKWELTLLDPGTRVGIELYARHAPGPVELGDGKKFLEPTAEAFLVVGKGKVFFESGVRGVRLTAPPGPALVHWNSIGGEAEVRQMEKLPPELAALTKTDDPIFKAICTSCACLNEGKVGPMLDTLLGSNEKGDRLVGVTVAGAVNDLPRVLKSLIDPKHADLRDHSILVLRHWMGRGTGHLEQLVEIMKKAGYPEVRARTALQLLVGFDHDQLAEPETYALLLRCLQYKHLPIRELARWHLVRLVPAGRAIGFDAAAPEAQRQRAVERWQALIPAGKVPSRDGQAPKK